MDNTPKEENSLENPETPEGSSTTAAPVTDDAAKKDDKAKKPRFKGGIQGIIARLNIYLLLFIFIMIISLVVVFIGIQRSKKDAQTPSIATQNLTPEELAKLNTGDTKVGDPKQTLTVESNAIFSGKVLLRNSLDVAGTLKVGGSLNITGLNVSGSSTFDIIQGNKLSITGDANIQGQLTVQKNLVITGGASFGGEISAPQITVQSLHLNGDLTFTRHIDAGGPGPGKSDGSGLGGGGTTSVSGTDTAGTVNINFGGGASNNACYITINFSQKFSSTPHVVISPASLSAAQLRYFTQRSGSNFQICAAGGSASGNAVFDYIVID